MCKYMYRVGGPKVIVKTPVIKFNEKSVWILEDGDAVRKTRVNQMHSYHALFSVAKEEAHKRITTKLVRAKRDVELYESQLKTLKQMSND